jgi:hypothetical protein
VEYVVLLGLWVPVLTRAIGAFELPSSIETPWTLVLFAFALFIALRKSESAGFQAGVFSLIACVLLSSAFGLLFSRGVLWNGLEVLYGQLGAYTALLMLHILPWRPRDAGKSPVATVYIGLLLLLDVLFVLKAREQGMLLSISSIPGIILVTNRMMDNRPAISSSSDAKAET